MRQWWKWQCPASTSQETGVRSAAAEIPSWRSSQWGVVDYGCPRGRIAWPQVAAGCMQQLSTVALSRAIQHVPRSAGPRGPRRCSRCQARAVSSS